MIAMTLAEIAAVVGGEVADLPATSAEVVVSGDPFLDSRSPVPAGLFVAIIGDHVDGHDFARAAVEAGAAAVLGSRPVGVPAVVVDDPTEALGRLARHVVGSLPDLVVIGVTGSQGKTGTKDVLAQVLEPHDDTIAPTGNYNNELGLPLTALRATEETRYLVAEMGARGVGHISYLASLVGPRVGVVLNVGVAHVGEFGSRAAIAQAKGELVEALPGDGVAVLNADDPLVAAMAARTIARVVTFGEDPSADVRIGDVRLDDHGRTLFTLSYGGDERPIALGLVGAHQAMNAAAAAAAAIGAGLAFEEVCTALADVGPRSRWRMEAATRADGVTVVNDAYNANPDSMRAGLRTLVEIAHQRPGARSIAVLGEMKELGGTSRDEHDAIGRLAVRLGVSQLVVVGDGARALHLGAALEGSWDGESVLVADVAEAIAYVTGVVRGGDVVLVKASRSAGLERVAAALLADPSPEAEPSPDADRKDGV